MKGKIYAYNTHYEIIDYELGEFPKLEHDLSAWDDIYHKSEPRFYYDESNKIMYVPRGYDPNILADHYKMYIDFITGFTDRRKVSFNLHSYPKDAAQKEAVRFLSGKNEYQNMASDTQLVLSMPPGDGKTYCTISALSLLGYRSLIIVNTKSLKDQWIEKFLEYTDISSKGVKDISSSKIMEKMMTPSGSKLISGVVAFVVTHDTLRNYMKLHGVPALGEFCNHVKIGVKVIDETHLDYVNTLMIDYGTNVWKTIYLSATVARSDNKDNMIFQKSFNMIHKLKIESENRRRHVTYFPYIYQTKPSMIDKETVRGIKGFDKYRYSDYQFKNGKLLDVLKNLLSFFIDKQRIEGKIVILSSKKETCDILKDMVSELYPAYSMCVYYTGDKREDYKDFGIIFATPKMLGTGIDIPGLRIVVNLEPTRSTVNTMQIMGRLREFAPDKDTYYVELIDKAFSTVWDMYKVRSKFLSSIVKKIFVIDETIIKY